MHYQSRSQNIVYWDTVNKYFVIKIIFIKSNRKLSIRSTHNLLIVMCTQDIIFLWIPDGFLHFVRSYHGIDCNKRKITNIRKTHNSRRYDFKPILRNSYF